MKKKTVCISICILLIIAVLPTSGTIVEKSSILSFGGKTIYVGGNGPGNYSKIQEAINDSSDDDTVYVYNGTYNENVIVNKSIDLIGEDKNTTKINGCVYISADYVIFSNFTLQYEYYYSGIYLNSNYSVIRNNIIDFYVSNILGTIAGIYLDYSNNNTIIDNHISIRGYSLEFFSQCVGIYICFSNNNIITGNNISNNTCYYYSFDGTGYGILDYYSKNNTIIGNIISNNDIGIEFYKTHNNSISGNSIFTNSIRGIVFYKSINNSISYNNFSHNYFSGIHLYESNRTNIFFNDFVDDGIFIDDSYFNTIENNQVNGRPLIYLVNKSNHIITDAGQIILVNCSNITVENLNLTFTSVSVELWDTNNCKIIDNNCSNSSYGIYIENSNNNKIQNNINSNTIYGISLRNTNNNTISNNSINWNSYGILNSDSKDNILSNNNISNNGHGIYLGGSYSGSGSKNITITGNTICSSRYMDGGIVIVESKFINITGNIISNNNNGIYVSDFASHIIIKDNIISNNSGLYRGHGMLFWGSGNISVISNKINSNQGYGINLFTGSDYKIYNNSLSENGLGVYAADNNNIENNSVNEKPLVYLENKSDRLITDAGQVILNRCNNITIDNLNLSNASIGINLIKSNYCNIKNNNCSDGLVGLIFRESNNITIIGNKIISNIYSGISLDRDSNFSISKNIITSNNRSGIEIDFSENITVTSNNISENEYGIRLYATDYSNIIRNNISNNNEEGLEISNYCSNNTVYHNNFIDNGGNAYCKGDNIWDDGYPSGGNYWDNYNGVDDDGDGIGDTPYNIPGCNDEDRYPLMYPKFNDPPDAPIIDGPTRGKIGYEYKYNFSLSDPDDDLMYLRVDWGNGTPGPWQGPYNSKTSVSLNHTWNQRGTFTIRAQTKDIFGAESEWGELKVRMPKNKPSDLIVKKNRLANTLPILNRNIIQNVGVGYE